MKKITFSKCRNCGEKIRKHQGIWVHEDVDEDPSAEDYGWVRCLPTENGTLTMAEPAEPSKK